VWVKKVLLLIVLLAVGLYGLGAVLFLMRDDDELGRPADAVVVLGGSSERIPTALDLVADGAAPVLVISEDDTGGERARICREREVEGAEVICFRAEPLSTRGEAREIAGLVDERGWDRIIVVTSRSHLLRAGRLIGRCTDADLVMRGAEPEPLGTDLVAIPVEWAKLVLAETARRGC
jgi:uncharacterized SAM-binding protein YcdF (DUF218 family)